MRTPVFEPQGFSGTRNPTFGALGRGVPKLLLHRTNSPPLRSSAAPMADDLSTQADRWAAWPARAPACLPGESKQLAGAAAGLGRQVGLPGGRQVSLCFSWIFPFLFFCKFADFLKIPR